MTIPNYRVLTGDCVEQMMTMESESVNTCVTSPPYFGLRDYGHNDQIGLESTPELFVEKMVHVFREVRRVMRDDGTLWLNLGDSYASQPSWGRGGGSTLEGRRHGEEGGGSSDRSKWGLKAKDLVGIPWMVAFALRADGWYLRQDIIWSKPNPMPESVTDRCTKAHEYLFMLTKSPRYYFDHEAIKEPAVKGSAGSEFHTGKTGKHQLGRASTKTRSKRDSFKRDDSKRAEVIPGQSVGTHRPDREESSYDTETRNKRSVWTVATRPFKGAHFATFPPALITPCVLAGCPVGGTVLDPFGGSGTTAEVAIRNNRNAVLCELNPQYVDLIHERLSPVMKSVKAKAAQTNMFA